ncbi:hypothetical protein [Oricola sp.]|uniref:hypothetical protein n=1 Tax=Oricola sp. TaxID=1979950 RepID=UPI0025E708E8|nr:hypothetical protein [Oricola sp.]MCI5075666.1 hypothetical protein [Oricola sp.]
MSEETTLTIDTLLRSMRTIELAPAVPRFIPSAHLVDTIEDWSDCRSPSRAMRRRRQGHRQRVRFVQVPKPDGYRVGNDIFMHPATLQLMQETLSLAMADRIESVAFYRGGGRT